MKKNFSFKILDRYDWLALAICLAAFVLWMTLLTYKYYCFGYYDWDLAFYSQIMWNLTKGELHSSLLGMNFLANHAEYIAFLLVPIYAVFQHPLTLIFLKVFSFMTAAHVLYFFGKNLVNPRLGIIVLVLFLLYPGNVYALLYEFHFESLAVGLLMLMCFFFFKDRFKPFVITMILAGLIKENIQLVIVMFGVWAVIFKKQDKWKWTLTPLLFGLGMFIVSMFLLTPMIRSGLGSPNQYLGCYGALGASPGEIANSLLFHPFKIANLLFTPFKWTYLKDLFSPLLFLPLFSPQILIPILPLFAQHLLTGAFQEQTLYYHYVATLSPFIFLACLHSLRLIKNKTRPYVYGILLTLFAMASMINLYQQRSGIIERLAMMKVQEAPLYQRLIDQIPPKSSVMATLSFLDQLSHRGELYAFMNVLNEAEGISGKPYEFPGNVDFALIDFEDVWIVSEIDHHPERAFPRLDRFFASSDWNVLDAVGNTVLFQNGRNGGDGDNAGIKILERAKHPFVEENAAQSFLIDKTIELVQVKADLSFGTRKALIPIVFEWKVDAAVLKDYRMEIVIRKGNELVSASTHLPGYTWYPTSRWQKGEYLQERYWLQLPISTPGQYHLELVFYIPRTQYRVPIEPMATGEKANSISIGDFSIP